MKNLIILLFLISIISFETQAQKLYSVENLEQASQEDLNTYLDKALKLQKNGKTWAKVGGITLGAGLLTGGVLAISVEGSEMIGASIIILSGITGISALTVGISMNATGKKRVERINTIKNTSYDGIKIDLRPYREYNLATQNYHPAVTLRISF